MILFGWDGAQREHVQQCLERGELPTLKKLSEEGVLVEEDGVKYLVFEGSPYYTMHKSCDLWEFGLAKDRRVGMRQDVAPTILARFGLQLGRIEPALDGEPLTEPATKPVLKAPENKGGRRQTPADRSRRALLY